jgi:hypothetical protein
MYQLRRAQYVPNTSQADNREIWNTYLDQANTAFEAGEALVTKPEERLLEWPGLAEPIKAAEILKFGQSVVDTVRSNRCRNVLRNDPRASSRAFFERYRVLGCLP